MRDREVAKVLNKIEELQLRDPDEKRLNSLVNLLYIFKEDSGINKIHIGEIRSCVEEVIEYYKREGKKVPDTSFLYS